MNEAVKAKAVQEFSKIQSNAEKVEFVESKTEELDTMPLLSTTSKNNNKAEQLRMQGNVYFESKQLLKAMEMYNQSICFAEANSEALGIGYANRSSIYFLWKKYELCLNNIELATANGCPHRLMNKLNNRKNDCVAAAKPSHTGDDDKCAVLKPILSFPPHPVVPFIADCLELRESSEFGRHIVTKIDLRAGQVVAIEENFCKILRPKFKYQRCTNCLREYDLNLFPCKRCTSAMFCGEKCAVEADQHFHRIECPIIEWLSVHFADEIFIHKAVRMTLRVINSFNDMDSLRSSIRKVVPQTTVFDLNHRTDMPANERYEAIRGLQTNEDKRTPSELWELAGLAAILYRILMNNTSLGDVIKTDPDKKVLKELLFRHILMWPTATIPFDELSGIIPNPTKDCSSYGDGLFAFHGLLNHSCEPNCLTVCFDRHSTLFVRRPIQAGEQLFISYGVDHVTKNVAERKEELFTRFKFDCQCKACKSGDFYDDMGNVPSSNVPAMLTWTDFSFIADKEYIRNNLQRYLSYINEYDRHYPCRQLCAADGCLLSSLHVLYSETSLNHFENEK